MRRSRRHSPDNHAPPPIPQASPPMPPPAPHLPLRTGENPLAHQLIEENSRLRRERNDWMAEAERIKREYDAYRIAHIDGCQTQENG